jgi:hypothetical protein
MNRKITMPSAIHVIMYLFVVLASFGAGCKTIPQENHEERNAMPTRDINEVKEAHTAELMALPGVVGVYIGARDDSTLCIRVMVVAKTPELEKKIPSSLEGHPVEIEETGVIRPLSEQQNKVQ